MEKATQAYQSAQFKPIQDQYDCRKSIGKDWLGNDAVIFIRRQLGRDIKCKKRQYDRKDRIKKREQCVSPNRVMAQAAVKAHHTVQTMGFAVTARLESIETTTPEPPNHRAIGNAFFPKAYPAVHLIEDCGVFAVGSLMRPIGSLVVLRPIGDLAGRKAILLTRVGVMAGQGLACLAKGAGARGFQSATASAWP